MSACTSPVFRKARTGLQGLLLVACAVLSAPALASSSTVIQNPNTPQAVGTTTQAVVTAVAAPIASAQTASLISGAIGGALSSGLGGGFTSGGGGFSPGGAGNSGVAPAARFALPGQGVDGDGTGLAAASPGAKPWNAWFSYTGSSIGFDFQPLKMSGRVDAYALGVDYTTQWSGMRTVMGVAVVTDRSKLDTQFNGGRIEGRGNMVTPYLGLQLNRNWNLSAALGLGDGKTKSNALGVTGDSKADRSLANFGFGYSDVFGSRWLLSANGSYTAARSETGAYSLSNGTFVVRSATQTSQLRMGGRATYNAGTFFPYAGLSYIYDLRAPDKITAAGQTSAGDRDGFQGVLGVQVPIGTSVSAGIQYSSDRGRSQVKNDSVTINLGLRW